MNSLVKFCVVFCALCAVGISGGTYYEQKGLEAKVQSASRGITVNVSAPAVQERVINLPEDGNAFYTTLFLPANWQKDGKSRTLRAWFDTQYQLASLKSQTHFNVVTTADAQWSKYAPTVPVLPSVCLTTAAGDVYFKASGDTIPSSPSKLATAIDQSIERRCPNRKCPWKEEEPTPTPPAVPDTTPVVPDTVPHVPDVTPPVEEGFPLWLGVILGLGGAGLAVGPDVVKKWKAIG